MWPTNSRCHSILQNLPSVRVKYCCHSNILCWVAKHKATCRFSTYLTVRVVGFGHTSSWTQKKPERARPINTTALCGILVVSPDSHTWIRARSSMNARRLASLLAASSEEIPASPPPPPPGCTALAGAAAAAAVTDDVALAGEGLGCYDETKRCQVRRSEKARKTSSI